MEVVSVLLMGGGLQGLCIARSLYNKGHQVDLISSRKDIAYYSRYFRKRYTRNPSDYLTQVSDLVKANSYKVIVPMSDSDAAFLSINKEHFGKLGAQAPVPFWDIFELGADKSRLMAFCEANGFSHPKTRPISADTLDEVAHYVGFPSLVKPNHSVGARGITRVNDMKQFQEAYRRIMLQHGECSLQQYIDNQEFYYNVMMYRTLAGDTSANAIIEIRRKYPLNAGSSSFCVSVVNDKLTTLCRNVLDKMDWHGMADFDILYDPVKDEFFIIEINPRVPASVRGGVESGVDFADAMIRDLVGFPRVDYKYQPGKQLRYFGLDLMWFIKSPERFSYEPSWFIFWGKELFYQDCYIEDPLPFLMSFPLKIAGVFGRK